MVEKCQHCKQDFVIRCFKKYYAYRLREYGGGKMYYFCSYSCMQKDKKEHPKKYSRER